MSAALSRRESEYLVPEERAILLVEGCANEMFKATTIPEVKRLTSQAEAIAAVVRASEASERVKKDAEFLIVRAERRLGEITSQMPKATSGRPGPTPEQQRTIRTQWQKGKTATQIARDVGIQHKTVQRVIDGKPVNTPTAGPTKRELLAQHGITSSRVSVAEQLAAVPKPTFEKALAQSNPTVSSVATTLGILGKQAPPKKEHEVLAEKAIDLLDTCCKSNRPPRRDEVNALQLRLAALRVTK